MTTFNDLTAGRINDQFFYDRRDDARRYLEDFSPPPERRQQRQREIKEVNNRLRQMGEKSR
jgi:hypothetical protein